MKVKFFKTITLNNNSSIIDIIQDGAGDSVADDIYIQVFDSSSPGLVVSGQVLDSSEFSEIGVIALKTMATIQSITGDGIYVFNGSGYSGIKLTATGSCKATIKVLA